MASFIPDRQDMPHRYDSITADELRRSGQLKWSVGQDQWGAWVAESDFGTAPAVTVALADAIGGAGLGYLPQEARRNLENALAGFMQRHFAWEVDPQHIWLAPDVLSILQLAIEELTDPGTPIVLPTPAYMPFLELPKAHNREIIEVPLINNDGHYTYDLVALDAAFASGAQLLVLCNPHNPVGRVLSRQELLDISAVAARHQARVFSDEIHSPLVYGEHEHIPFASLNEQTARQAITAISASKAFNLPGLKCAQMIITNPEDQARWPQVVRWLDSQASTIGTHAATAAYTDSDIWLEDLRYYLEGNLRELNTLIAEHLPQVVYQQPEGTYLTWLDFRHEELAEILRGESPAEFFRRHGIITNDGATCGAPGFVRLNAATPRPILREIIRMMGEALGDLKELREAKEQHGAS